ncbi:MAG: DUF3549 family protein [Pseudomonadales bacterium]|jgi:hypothetical protein
MTDQLLTLSALLEQADLEVATYDLSRQIRRIDHQDWLAFERGEQAWENPVQAAATFAIVGLNKQQIENSVVWFFQLPLDERMHLNLGARDGLIDQLLSRAAANAENLNAEEATDLQAAAKDLSASIQPPVERRAKFHSMLRVDNQLASTDNYQLVKRWLDNPEDQDVDLLPLQGLADLSVRLNQPGVAQKLSANAHLLGDRHWQILAHLLENEALPALLIKTVESHLQAELTSDRDATKTAALLQSLAGCDAECRQRNLLRTLNSAHGISGEVIGVVAGRFWNDLQQPDVCRQFFSNLLQFNEGISFVPVVRQLMTFEQLRPFIIACLNQPFENEQLEALRLKHLGH